MPSVSEISHVDLNSLYFVFRFDGKDFENVPSSKCDHEETYGLANYRGKALTTGSWFNSGCYVRTELYDFKTNRWNDAPDYPFARFVNKNQNQKK